MKKVCKNGFTPEQQVELLKIHTPELLLTL